jgi:hypothetical protein
MKDITVQFKPINSSTIDIMKKWSKIGNVSKDDMFDVKVYNFKKWQKFIPHFILKLFIKPTTFKCCSASPVNLDNTNNGDKIAISYEYESVQ